MKKNPTFLLLLLTILFSSCYTSAISYNNLNRIERGMFPKDVIAILGEPIYRSFDDKSEILEFRSSEYPPARVVRIRFVDNKVVEMESYLDRYDNCRDENKTSKEKKEDERINTHMHTCCACRAMTRHPEYIVSPLNYVSLAQRIDMNS